jgi:hypothetical protein
LETEEELASYVPGKKLKKSLLNDFRHPDHFISDEPPINQVNIKNVSVSEYLFFFVFFAYLE